MTLNQLLKEVYALGFDEADALDESFVFCVNRALKMIFIELIPSQSHSILVNPEGQASVSCAQAIDVRDYVKNPMIITAPPKDQYGNIIKGAYTEGYLITVPKDYTGTVVVEIKPLPESLSVDDGEKEIDIPAYCSHLPALLTASFVFLDDDIEKSDYYMSVYRNEVNRIKYTYSTANNNSYTDVNGWA